MSNPSNPDYFCQWHKQYWSETTHVPDGRCRAERGFTEAMDQLAKCRMELAEFKAREASMRKHAEALIAIAWGPE